ncbi:MAG: cupredoxin domain-containing protein [Acidimicrobiales bacterium]
MRRLVIVALLAALAACGGNTKVGNQNLLNIKDKTSAGFDVTTTTAPTSGTLPPVSTTSAPPTTAAPVKRTSTTLSPAQQQAITAEIKIEGSGSAAFVPSLQTVYPGTPVKWVNTDKQVRAVVSDDGGTFSSGAIAPGGSYTWIATGPPRRINYHDGTRPYAVGALSVVPAP